MAETIEHDCREDIGGDVQEVSEVDTAYEQVTHKLVLFPPCGSRVTCTPGKRWPVYVNAHTGTMTGERPYSKAKIAAAVLVAVIVVVLVYPRDREVARLNCPRPWPPVCACTELAKAYPLDASQLMDHVHRASDGRPSRRRK
jgi:hypothetical protein